MKQILAVFLLSAILFTSCSAASEKSGSAVSADTETTAADNSPYAAIENGTERWLKIGLDAYLSDYVPDFDAAAFFLENANNTQYLSLYNDMYIYDNWIFGQISALLYRFIHDTYGYDTLFDLDKRVEFKDAWLKSLDPSLAYTNQTDSEAILSTMECSYDSTYSYIITLEGVTYSFYDYKSVSPSLAHTILYYNTLGLRTLKEELASIDPDEAIFDLSASLGYILPFDGSDSGLLPDGTYTVGRYEDMLVGAAAMMTNGNDPDAHWITEGLAEIFGKARGYYYMTVYDRVFFLMPDYLSTYIQPIADEGNPAGIYYLGIGAYYSSLDGKMEKNDDGLYEIDGSLYTDAAAMIDLQIGYQPILSDLYDVSSDGGELSRIQAGSFVQRLIDTYGLDAVLSMAHDYSKFEEICGAGYDSVKAAWRNYLNEKFS